MKKKVYVIGAGASGLIAAISCSMAGAEVTILESQNKIGKKLLITGNGKCNLSNINLNESCYVSLNDDKELKNFVSNILDKVSVSDLIDFYQKIGMNISDEKGYLYPSTLQAQTVVNVLLRAINQYNITLKLNTKVNSISSCNNQYKLTTNNGNYNVDYIILACGGKSYNKTGSDGSGYEILQELNLKTNNLAPGLTSIISNNHNQKLLSGMRLNGDVHLYSNNKLIRTEIGQIQFTDYGLSGIAIFNQGLFAQKNILKKNECEIGLDLFPNLSIEHVKDLIKNQLENYSNCCIEEALQGILHSNLIAYICKHFQINGKKARTFDDKLILNIANELKDMRFAIRDFKGYEFSQVTLGGLDLSEINENFELKKYKNIYVIGELLDVSGLCGGYNLHFAFASGYLSGQAAAKIS